MTMPATPPSSPEQVIEQRLVECGLNKGGFTVKYEGDLQSIEVVINSAAGTRNEHFPCIRQAVEHEIVSFADSSTKNAYSEYVSELLRPQMLADARAELQKRGLLKNFPDRDRFASLELYAQALERQSGLEPGSSLRVSGKTIVFDPAKVEGDFKGFDKRYSSLIAAIMFATTRGDFKDFVFVGNEAFAKSEGK